MRIKLGEQGEDGIYSLYKVYKKNVQDPMDFKTYRRVIFSFNKALMVEILEGASNIKLPARLGCIRVKKTQMTYKRLMFDYGEYNKSGLKTYHTNTHSDDFKVRILWEKSKCIISGKAPWSFTPARINKRRLAKLMKEDGGHKRYTEELSIYKGRQSYDNQTSTD